MSDYKLLNKKDLSRLSEAEVQALGETDKVINETKRLVENYQDLVKCLEDLPKRENEEMMVPLGKVAYMPGKLVKTNHVTMALGDSWFIETSTKHAQAVVQRRIKALEDQLGKLKEQKRLFEDRFDYTERFTKEGEEFVEISEECTEEEYTKFKVQHRENFTKSRSKAQTQNEEKMNLDDFFANYNEEDDDDNGDKSKNKARDINDGIASESNVEDGRIHEGYRSLLSDLGIDCANIEFTNGVTQGLDDVLPEDNKVTCEEPGTESGTSESHFVNLSENDDSSGDIRDSMDTLPPDGPEQFQIKHSDEGFKEDIGFKILLDKLGFNLDETCDSKSSLAEEVFSDQLPSKGDTNIKSIENTKTSTGLKKSVTWEDEAVANTGDDHDHDHGEEEEDSEEESKPETITLNFKHSQASSVSLKPCTDETDPITIKTPGEIYTKMCRPKSILKHSKKPPKISVQEKPADETKVTTKKPSKVLQPAVSALVVERTFDNHLQDTDTPKHSLPSQPPSENSRPHVSKFKARMARKCQQATY